MAGAKWRCTVNYLDPSPGPHSPVRYAYILSLDEGARDDLTSVNLTSVRAVDEAHVCRTDKIFARTQDVKSAFAEALALLDAHHAGLTPMHGEPTKQDPVGR